MATRGSLAGTGRYVNRPSADRNSVLSAWPHGGSFCCFDAVADSLVEQGAMIVDVNSFDGVLFALRLFFEATEGLREVSQQVRSKQQRGEALQDSERTALSNSQRAVEVLGERVNAAMDTYIDARIELALQKHRAAT
jgi:hypothetical protein